ncbi:MAG: hypothetical protein R3332_05075 [Pseudohongiellaceae bacterium]|nr:hypothetical protein [Pseudohongiellaceae bacterium]
MFITGRAKEIIIRGGENIGCAEVEFALAEHPKVREVCIFGIPDERLGELVGAAVVVKDSSTLNQEQLQDFLSERLAQFKVPSKIWLFDKELARLAAGKIDKKQVRSMCLASLERRKVRQSVDAHSRKVTIIAPKLPLS